MRPVDLDRWRVGDASVDALTREIRMPGARRPVRVTPKALAVLRVLAAQPGQVVTRRALLDEVWPETLPTDDVLTQAVTQLRKAFGSGAGGAEEGRAYIETIAKSGYRLLREVEALAPDAGEDVPQTTSTATADTAAAAGTTAEPPTPENTTPAVTPLPAADGANPGGARAQGWRAATIVAICVLLAAVGVLSWSLVRDDDGGADARTGVEASRLITSSLGFKGSPSLSPDGSQVAYAAASSGPAGSVIMVQPTRNAPARVLARAGAARGGVVTDSIPRWSPDGRDIAFLRRLDGNACAVMVADVRGGDVREVARCDGARTVSFDWTADGSGLLFGTMDGDFAAPGVRVLDLRTGAWQPLAYDHIPGAIDHAPRVSPDGRWILFARNPQLGDLWRVPVAGGRAEQLTTLNTELRGWAWASAGRVVFGRRVDSEVRLYALDPASGAISDLGFDDAQAPSMVAANGALAFVRRNLRFGLFRVAVDPSGAIHKQRLFASNGRDNTPAVSPDGSRLAFGSDRAGPYELWLAKLGAEPGEPTPVPGITPIGSHAPTWSADGRHLLVAGVADAVERGATTLYEVDAGTAAVRALAVPVRNPVQALRLDARQLVVAAQVGDGPLQLVLLAADGRGWRQVRALEDVSQFRHDPVSGRILFTRLSGDGLWEASTDLRPGSVRQVDPHHPRRVHYRTWSPSVAGAIDYVVSTPECRTQLNRLGGAGGSRQLCLSVGRRAATSGFSSSTRDGTLYLSMVIDDGMEIGFTHLPQPRPSSTLGIVKSLTVKGKPVS
ncbi:hypothetical protein E4582_12155 [Luteimonas yindakuii]|uniref:OmpR/PhoB-type domain-containing protein n=1 Tax=Luteimonas yindakuii TaxID=2565782 RepID=A0A4Z1RE54_9GAMM|nr:winged helix-turn-helix domain-containing protein [Luteimonas yindakuii]TKS52957.1 hypothetical protein E4582_12155 [Luteimonas yindakuii]